VASQSGLIAPPRSPSSSDIRVDVAWCSPGPNTPARGSKRSSPGRWVGAIGFGDGRDQADLTPRASIGGKVRQVVGAAWNIDAVLIDETSLHRPRSSRENVHLNPAIVTASPPRL
jgi:hypothetical protein